MAVQGKEKEELTLGQSLPSQVPYVMRRVVYQPPCHTDHTSTI